MLASITVGALVYEYDQTTDHARVMKTVPRSGGTTRITCYLGPDAEFDDAGKWTNYVHDDVKRVGKPRLIPKRRAQSRRSARSLRHCSSSARLLPSSVEAKPHCGDRHS